MANADAVTKQGRTIQISNKLTLGRASILMGAMIGLSRITGFGRMVLTSILYGRNELTDAYNAAFNIPETISIIIAGGALATGFVPVFTEYLSQGKQEEAQRTFRAMFTLLGVVFGLLTASLFLLTFTPLGTLLAPKDASPEAVNLYLRILRILLIAQFFFVIGGMFAGTLNALRLFWYPALQPVMFNLGIIGFGILLPYSFGMGIESQAWGALVGALIGSIIIQLPAVLSNGLSLQLLWDLRDPGVQRLLRSLLPIFFGLASGQIIALNLPRFFGVGLPLGDLTALDNANRLMQVPLDVLASGPAIALFPTLSLLYSEGKIDELRTALAAAQRRALVLTLLATALIMALSFPLVHLLLEHGEFKKADTKFTALIVMCYGLCIVGLGTQRLLARGYYAMQDTRGPIIIGMVGMILFGLLATGVMAVAHDDKGPTSLAAPGLAISATVSISIIAIWMWLALKSKLKGWDNGATLTVLWKGSIAAVAACITARYLASYSIIWITNHGFDSEFTLSIIKILARLGVVMVGTIGGTIAFLIVATALKLSEIEPYTNKVMKLFK